MWTLMPVRQYTVVVLDDAAGLSAATVNRVARAGRGKGVTLIPTMQGTWDARRGR